MSWLARSIVNTLHLDDDGEDDEEGLEEERISDAAVPRPIPNDAVPPEDRPRDNALSDQYPHNSDSDGDSGYDKGSDDEDLDDGDCNQGRGVKEDLSEFRDSLTRQLWGVASFLAPQPPPPPPPLPPPPFGGRSGVVRFKEIADEAGSHHHGTEEEEDVEEGKEEEEELGEYDETISGQVGDSAYFSPSEDYYANMIEEAIGITDEVLAFARNIAHHPETWLDFPSSEEEEFDGEGIF